MKLQYIPDGMNIELTNCCPLRCPQCYCTLEGGKHIPLETAVTALKQASQMGIAHVELSGGETMCYPYLYEVVKAARDNGISPNIAISGWHFDRNALSKLIDAGIEGIYVSLNGPTEELNSITRDGFDYAIEALSILKEAHFEQTHINWVMHRQTADYLPEMYALADKYCVKTIVIMMPKPDAANQLESIPTSEQMLSAVDFVKSKKGAAVQVAIEKCFSPLLALLGRNAFWGNLNRGIHKGCGAGLTSLNVSVDGLYSPCRHIYAFEKWGSLQDYWERSDVLNQIRAAANNTKEPCARCQFKNHCRSCIGINTALHNEIFVGFTNCPIRTD